MLAEILDSQEASRGQGGDLGGDNGKQFPIICDLNHSYRPRISQFKDVHDTFTKTPCLVRED